MAGFVACHFVNGIVDSVEVEFLGAFGDTVLVFASTTFSVHALLEVGLGVPNAVAEEFSKLSSVLCLFPSVTLESLSHFGITFAVSLTAHGQIHTYFCAFAHEVVVEVLNHFIVATFGNAESVLCYEVEATLFGQFLKLAGGNFAHGALLRGFGTFVDITTDGADKFLVHWCSVF